MGRSALAKKNTHGKRQQRGKEESIDMDGRKGKENWNKIEMIH